MLGLKWTPEKEKQLMLVIQSRKKAKFGISCIYYALSKAVGVKIYCSEKERDKTCDKQSLAAKHGLAPTVGDRFSFNCVWIEHSTCSAPNIRHRVVYGYLTQNAVLPSMRWSLDKFYPFEVELESKLRKIGLVYRDFHFGNVGYIGKKLVCIDFDWASCTFKAGRKKKVNNDV